MKKRKRVEFVVSFVAPPNATIAEMRSYIEDAVRTYKGCLRPPGSYDDDDPGSPLFSLDSDTVRVVRKLSKKPVARRN